MSRKRKSPAPLSKEEFAAWLIDPSTEAVLFALERAADANRAEWERVSWGMGQADPLLLTELRTRADAYRAMAEMSFADLEGVLE